MSDELLKAAADYEAHLKKTAAGGSLEERMTKLYETFIKETGAVLPKAMENQVKPLGVKLAVMKPREGGLKYQLFFDGYLLEGGRGERMPDFIGRVILHKTATMTNFMAWKMAVSRVGQSREVEDGDHVDSGHTPSGLAEMLAYNLKRMLQSALK